MSEPSSALAAAPEATRVDSTIGFASYAQLVRMLLPRSGNLGIYDASGGLVWCSGGYERPEFRERIDTLVRSPGLCADRALFQANDSGFHAFVATLRSGAAAPLGWLIVELRRSRDAWDSTVVAGLLTPVLRCLQSQLELQQVVEDADDSDREALDLLLALERHDAAATTPLSRLMQHSIDHLDCTVGAMVITDTNLKICCANRDVADQTKQDLLTRTEKNLLAWAELNSRPMLANRVTSRDGTLPYKILSCPVRRADGSVNGVFALFRDTGRPDFDLRDVRILEYIVRRAMSILDSRHDPLTGLVNRLIFESRVGRAVEAATEEARPSLLYIDVDRLAVINETFGYHAGDEVLRRVADTLQRHLGPDDLACRLDGDRFAAFLGKSSLEQAEQLAAGLSNVLSQMSYLDGSKNVGVSVSIGVVALSRTPGATAHDLAAAELACKRAKENVRERVFVAQETPEHRLASQKRLFASIKLQQALKNNEFCLEAQPIVGLALSTGEIMGHEVLVRLRDSQGQLVPPGKFLDAARHYRMMPALDRWVIARTAALIKDSGLSLSGQPNQFVLNVSSQSLVNDGFADFVLDQLLRARLPTQAFRFELAESSAIRDLRATRRFFETLVEAGCEVGLDDFGIGLSSFANLKHLPVRYIRIDGALIRRMGTDRYAESLVQGIAKAAEILGIFTIAEHIESAEQADRLTQLDISFGQGFHLGKPSSFEDLLQT